MEILFRHDELLYGLWGLVPLAALLLYARGRRQRAARRLLDATMGKRLVPQSSGLRTYLPLLLTLLAFASLLLAGSRPRFGMYFEKVAQRGADLVVILDVSRSMLSEDVHPNRLERSKSYIRDLLEAVKGDRVGLVVFAGKAVAACPLTVDRAFFESILAEVGPESAPRGGTVIGDAIREAVQALDDVVDRDRAFVLITDGEDHDSFPLEAAATAADMGVKIFTVGIGDPGEGARIPEEADGGGMSFVKHEGQEVWSKMDEDLLKEIALTSGGAYVPVRTGTYDLGQVYTEHLAELRAGELDTEKRKRYREQYQLFAGIGLLLFLLSMILSPYRRSMVTLAAALFLLAWPATDAVAGDSIEGAEKHNLAVEKFVAGDVEQALDLFDAAARLAPDEPRIELGQGAALQRTGELDTAAEHYRDAAAGGDAEATALARYNLGTVAAERAKTILGDVPEDAVGEARTNAVAEIEKAIEHFRATVRLDRNNEDARYNLELLRVWLKHIEDAWKKKDEQQQTGEKDVIQLLEEYMDRQWKLWRETRTQDAEAPSPKRDEALSASGDRQRDLAAECGNLKPKIDERIDREASLHQTQGSGGASEEQIEQFRQILHGLHDGAVAAMGRAADALAAATVADAPSAQKEAFDQLDVIWRMLASFEMMLKYMFRSEQGIVEQTAPLAETPGIASPCDLEVAFLVEDQERVGALAPILEEKARMMEQGLDDMAGTQPPAGQEIDEELKEQLERLREQKEAIEAGLAKALENVPLIPDLSASAVLSLRDEDFGSALPDEEEILRLLREILELWPNQDQQQSGSDQDQQKEPEDQEKQEDQQDQQDEKDQKDQQQQSDQEKKEQEQQELTEELLQQALDREKEYKEKKKELQKLLAVPIPVEKDW